MKRSLFIFLIVLLVFFGAVSWIWQKFNRARTYDIDISRAAIIKQMQALNRYETTSFTIEKIIEAGTEDGNALQNFLLGDRILLIAHGEVIAGFDLTKITEKDIQINNKNITITLPPAEILVARLDSEKTRVYDRKQGLLTQGDKDLETQARIAAEQSIKKAACEGNILTEAMENGRAQLTVILKAVGFETVVVNIPVSSC